MNLSKKTLSALGAVFALVVAVLVTLLTGTDDGAVSEVAGSATSATVPATAAEPAAPASGATSIPETTQPRAPGVPDRAYDTLAEIDAGRWPESADAPGTKGGQRFMNREGNLPDRGDDGAQVTYQEWDVNPKQPGRSRDAERIVTGSDGSAWYTGDHYETFTRMR